MTRGDDHPHDPTPRRPSVVVFDVNETLSDMSPMAQRFRDVGGSPELARTWFASVLRDGFALAAVDTNASFADIASDALLVHLHGIPLDRAPESAVEHIMAGFAGLPVHPDVRDGIEAMSAAGLRLVTLSNGSSSVADALLDRAGIRDHFEALLSVEDAGVWKPAAGAYAYAVGRCGIDPGQALLVAVHPWDIDGAARAGLGTAWVNRADGPYPSYFTAPGLRVRSLTELAEKLV